VKVKLKDDVGNESELSSPYAFTIDTDGITPTIELKNSTAFPKVKILHSKSPCQTMFDK